MPNSPNAKKALRQSEKRRLAKKPQRAALRTVLKKAREAVTADDQAAAESAFRLAVKKLDQAASKGLIHKNVAARTKSRLSSLKKKSQSS
ncbi:MULTISPECIES: 30S ribosomal protein S20 [Thalassoglobus]|uniref:Small ribosomal subunit protein bS20 n=1 Tax=Thalassoglobus polymorphus TaxID=2527994 RepID=A0A517QS06_9PLAN|nr:30S ribosomal protein S20 [Thalassoglobus polymorphus]QDT34404.1 30S ribosomal protein S20 [Thalassoglobus polymorphus]